MGRSEQLQAGMVREDGVGPVDMGGCHGLEVGRTDGREEGLVVGLRRSVRCLYGAFNIELDAKREATIEAQECRS